MELEVIFLMLAFASFVKRMLLQLPMLWTDIRSSLLVGKLIDVLYVAGLDIEYGCLFFFQELDPTFSGTREYKLLAVC